MVYSNYLVSGDSHMIQIATPSFAFLSCLLSCLLAYFTFYLPADIYAVRVGKNEMFNQRGNATSALFEQQCSKVTLNKLNIYLMT